MSNTYGSSHYNSHNDGRSDYCGGNNPSGGRGRGGGRGRSGGGRGRSGGDSNVPQGLKALLHPCGHYTRGTCGHGNSCQFAHVVRLNKRLDASNPVPPSSDPYQNNNNSQNNPTHAAVSAASIWETHGGIKIITGSHDGFWRLWNTQGSTFTKEFEHNVGAGKVECLKVASNFLFCGFEATSSSLLGDTRVGMIHAWDLANPTLPPLEFHMHPLTPYAHAMCVTQMHVYQGDTIISGDRSGVIRVWKYGELGIFTVIKTMHGHAREVTGLAVVDHKLLWSCSIDGSIRLWDLTRGDCQYVITKNTMTNGAPCGHSGAVTGLLRFDRPGASPFVLSSSLDGTIKAWNGANGECVFSEDHQAGVVSMTLSQDLAYHPILIIGLVSGCIMVRNLVPTQKAPIFTLLLTLNPQFSTGHCGAVKTVTEGHPHTFYTGGADGKVLVFQITDDIGI